MYRRVGCILLAAVLFAPYADAQGVLERTRQATLDHSSPGVSVSGDGQWFHLGGGNPLGLLYAAVIIPTAPLWLPPAMLHDSILTPGYFPAHPYAIDGVHYIQTEEFLPRENDKPFYDETYLKPWAVRLSLEDGNDFGGLNRLGGRFDIDTAWRFGLATDWNYYHENIGTTHSDETVLGAINFTWRFAQSNWMMMHTGLGANMLTDRHGTRGGVNFLYNADVYPIDPMVLSAEINLGNIDNAFLIHARATVGWQIDRFELFAGYDFRRIGSINLQGPMAGVRLSF